MASRVVRPDAVKLSISGDDWLLVKKRLNAGEQRAMFARMYLAGVDGQLQANHFQQGLAKILAYLIDWSLTDLAGKTIVILGQPVNVVEAALDSLDPDSFAEIRNAIEKHEDAMDADRAQEKKILIGATPAEAISPSPSAVAGVLTGCAS